MTPTTRVAVIGGGRNCEHDVSEKVATPSESVARNVNRFRMGRLLALVVYFGGAAGAGAGPAAVSSLPSASTIFCRLPTLAPFFAAKM